MKCLICDRPLRHAKQSECDCGESLPFWTTQMNASQAIRQRGLAQAAKGNYVGACVSFLEAALGNPADQQNLIDAAKALAYGGHFAEARQLLDAADARYKEPKAAVLQAIARLEEHAKRREKPVARPAPAPEPTAVAEAITAPIPAPTVEPAPNPEAAPAPMSAPDAAPAPPAARPAPVAEAAPAPPVMPLLGLPIMRRAKKGLGGFFKKAPTGPLPAIWHTVLGMENSWPNRWQTVEHWIHAAAREAAKSPDDAAHEEAVFLYMIGLGHVQQSNLAEAVAAFDRCLQLQPPVLNPAAYYLFLHLDHPQNAQKAMSRLKNDYDKQEYEECRKNLLDRLATRGDAARAALLRDGDSRKK